MNQKDRLKWYNKEWMFNWKNSEIGIDDGLTFVEKIKLYYYSIKFLITDKQEPKLDELIAKTFANYCKKK